MRLAHISDLHLGKRLHEVSFLEDQAYILDEICKILRDEKPDAVLIAGDVYDRSAPSGEAVALLTHDPAEPYLSYVARVKENPIARRVKLADLRHNSDLSRIKKVTERDLKRVEQYAAAIRLLEA